MPLKTPYIEPITYCLLLKLPHTCHIEVGKIGDITFSGGIYAYIGSAKRNAQHRLNRHWMGSGKKKWHIDYLRAQSHPIAVWGFDQTILQECKLADTMECLSMENIPRFGSSDCHCPSHLYFCESEGIVEAILANFEHALIFYAK